MMEVGRESSKRAEALLDRLRTAGELDSDLLSSLLDGREVDTAALAGYLSATDSSVSQLFDLLASDESLRKLSEDRRRLATILVECVDTGDPFPSDVIHAFGVIGPHHETALRDAVRAGAFGVDDAVRSAFDGAALRRLLAGRRVEVEPIFESTMGITSRQSAAEPGPLRFEAPHEVPTTRGPFRLLVSNAVELWRAHAMPIFEPETVDWLEKTISDDSVLYDVGANIGYFTLYAWRLGAGGVVAFEPDPLNYSRLIENLHLNSTSSTYALPLALSDRSRIASFGFRDFVRAAASPYGVDPPPSVHAVTCICAPLDSLRKEEAIPAPTHMKIDVDGHEQQVLAGAEQTLADARLAHLLVEAHIEAANDVLGLLARFGFRNVSAHARGGAIANYIFERW